MLVGAGFKIEGEVSRRDLALKLWEEMRRKIAEQGPPKLGLHVLMGEAAKPRLANVISTLGTSTSGGRSGRASAPAPPSMKWTGASTWVPVWAPMSSRVTLHDAPLAIAWASSILIGGSPGKTAIPGRIGTVTSTQPVPPGSGWAFIASG